MLQHEEALAAKTLLNGSTATTVSGTTEALELVRSREADGVLADAAAESEEEPEGEQAPPSPTLSPAISPLTTSRVMATDAVMEEWLFQQSPFSIPTAIADDQTDGQAASASAALSDLLCKRRNVQPAAEMASGGVTALELSARKPVAVAAMMLKSPVPPPPPPCFPVCGAGVLRNLNVAVDPTPCLVELAASAVSSARTAEAPEYPEDGAPAGEECQRLLPGLLTIGSFHSSSSRSSPGAYGSSRHDVGDEATATPREVSGRSPPSLARFLSPMSSCAPSPHKPAPPAAPASSPARVLPPSGGWCPQPACDRSAGQGGEVGEAAPLGAGAATPRDASAWFRAARRTLLPLDGPVLGRLPSLEQLIEVARFAEPAEARSAGAFACWCTPQCSGTQMQVALEVAAASSIPATEARLLSVPRPSMRGLRATSMDPLPVVSNLPCAAAASSKPSTAAAASDGCEEPKARPPHHFFRSSSLPALPRQAPALPSRAPSGDNAVDAAELLLARVVDPFGEDGR